MAVKAEMDITSYKKFVMKAAQASDHICELLTEIGKKLYFLKFLIEPKVNMK